MFNIISANFYPLRFYQNLSKIGDNLRRAVQDLNLGVNDEPIALPEDIVNQAVAENRFILFGRPVIPRRQNLRSIIASMPRIWGKTGLVHSRIVEGRDFQFIFPNEESLESVLCRGPWAFNDQMLILQRWEPLLPLLNFIPFWTQIRGIPFQFLNCGVVEHIGRALGQVLKIDFDAEAVARVDFVRVLLHWDITIPVRFQRKFQFTAGVNTLFRFRYERLRGFSEDAVNQDGNNGPVEDAEADLADIDPNHDALLQSANSTMFQEEGNAGGQLFNPFPSSANDCLDISGTPHYNSLPPCAYPLAIMDSECVINLAPDTTTDRVKRKRDDEDNSMEIKIEATESMSAMNQDGSHMQTMETSLPSTRKRKDLDLGVGTSQLANIVRENNDDNIEVDATTWKTKEAVFVMIPVFYIRMGLKTQS
ncbi:unnamed protein product [Arabidopsis thaliana]|uniref:(thale cress) hypothetical protein n=1 Tax=Arabidopsis thaliana TaxID=3702 RepID=A0A7G2E5Z8_ARATH|nr:unnamed protein product [Arabidopsis thaliana]